MSYKRRLLSSISAAWLLIGAVSQAQMIDNTQAPNTAKAGINKSLLDEIGAGRGDSNLPAKCRVWSMLLSRIRTGRRWSC